MAFILWPPVPGEIDFMPNAILVFVPYCEILAEDGHGVPCPYEENLVP
jgi:hypothetical protein